MKNIILTFVILFMTLSMVRAEVQPPESAEEYSNRITLALDNKLKGNSGNVEPRHGGTLKEELRGGYTYIRMDRPETESAGPATGVTAEALRNQLNGNLVIVNYSYEGLGDDSASSKQAAFLNKVLPQLGKRSQRPIVFIDAVAMRLNPNTPTTETPYMANLLGELENNKLGPNDATVDFKSGEHILPYGYASLNGDMVYDFSYSIFDKNSAEKDIKKAIALNLLACVERSNNQLAGSSSEGN